MTHRPTILMGAAAVLLVALAASLAIRRGDAQQGFGTRASADARKLDASTCRAMWEEGFELEGVVGGRESQAYFDMWPVGDEELVSGIVVFPGERGPGVLADTPMGLRGPLTDDGCGVQLRELNGATDGGDVWELRIESVVLVKGTLRTSDRRTEPFVFNIVPVSSCDDAGEWRTFSAPDWPITFDYPASWKLTADHDDVNIECPSVTALAVGGSYLTFERGRFEPPNGESATENDSSFNEPYWFLKGEGDDWRVKGLGCDPEAGPRLPDDCYPARRSERNGMTVLQGAAGEHRLYRRGLGYLGQGPGIVRYLWVVGDRWVSLDSTEYSPNEDDIGREGGPVLFDGDAVGDRVVRSVKPR